MTSHNELTDAVFARAFDQCTLDPALFTHEAHLRMAWITIRQHGVDGAITIVSTQLKRFVVHAGAADKYNETVTIAATRAVHHFMQRYPEPTFEEFIRKAYRLKTNFRDLIACHYSQDIFRSEAARRDYLEPDLLEF
jgi:hypothetical protein